MCKYGVFDMGETVHNVGSFCTACVAAAAVVIAIVTFATLAWIMLL